MTDLIEATWQGLLTSERVDTALVRVAHAEPRLRRLFPWTGMWELHFSRYTEPRLTWDIPYIAPAMGGGFWVLGPSRSESVGWTPTAEEAVALVVERLPPGCGPAFAGTPEELTAHEEAQDSR